MRKALISPKEQYDYTYIKEWIVELGKPPTKVEETISNCFRVAQVEDNEFDVALPLFWVECPDECEADRWYYKDNEIKPKPENIPKPANMIFAAIQQLP